MHPGVYLLRPDANGLVLAQFYLRKCVCGMCVLVLISVSVTPTQWKYGSVGWGCVCVCAGAGVCYGDLRGPPTYHISWRKKRRVHAGEYSTGKENREGRKEKTRIPSAGRAVLRDWRFINTHTHAANTDIAQLWIVFSRW